MEHVPGSSATGLNAEPSVQNDSGEVLTDLLIGTIYCANQEFSDFHAESSLLSRVNSDSRTGITAGISVSFPWRP